jgi:hypothetical protein
MRTRAGLHAVGTLWRLVGFGIYHYDVFAFSSPYGNIHAMPPRWCTVTVTDANGRRHSLDLVASSTFDAAHLYLTKAKTEPGALPVPTRATIFEVVTGGRVYKVAGTALQRWIAQRRRDWNGPKGFVQQASEVGLNDCRGALS